MSKETFRRFMRHWTQFADHEIRQRVTSPGSQRFSLDDMKAEILLELAKDPMAKNFSLDALADRIVDTADRSRRPSARKQERDDLFRNAHKWIPVGTRERIRYCDATALDLNAWLALLNKQFEDQSKAYTEAVKQIQQEIEALLRTGAPTVGDRWTTELGWKPTNNDDSGDDDDGGEE